MLSFDFSFQVLMDQASQLVNGLWLVYMLPLGVALGVGLVGWIVSSVRKNIGE